MRRAVSKFLADQSGATAIEYALIATGVAMAIIVVVQGLGSTVNARYDAVGTALQNQRTP